MAKREAPDLSNATPEMLIDEMAKLSIMENHIKFMRGVYKTAYYARAGINVEEMLNGETKDGKGEMFAATTTRSDPNRVDTTLLKEEYPDVAEKVTRSKPQLTTRFTLKEGVTNPKVESLLEQMKMELDLN